MPKRFPDQAKEIESLLRESGLDPSEMAYRALIRPDTLRKIRNGYQRAGDHLMELLRKIAKETVRERPPEYRVTPLQRDVAFIERNATEDEKETAEAVLSKLRSRAEERLKKGKKK